MSRIPTIAVFDIGKTNKKLFLFDQYYHIVYEKSVRLAEIVDEDGFSCENIDALRSFFYESLQEVLKNESFDIKAINFSTYGASLVYIDDKGNPIAPLYNYLKPYPEKIESTFYEKYGGREKISLETASPCLGSLNSGLQLFRTKEMQLELFHQMRYALHLPQYISSLITGKFYSDITSIGCHTQLWDFRKNTYHAWSVEENIVQKLAPVFPSDKVISCSHIGKDYLAGVGLHDSSAALIPYLTYIKEPFLLISTGTWCISINPFNQEALTKEELENDCLCYLDYKGKPIKASRLFAGYFHEEQLKRIAAHFNVSIAVFDSISFKIDVIKKLNTTINRLPFASKNLFLYLNEEEAYHDLMIEIIEQQYLSVNRVLQKGQTKKIFVDGGFGKNNIYMNLLAMVFQEMEVYAATTPQATAMGAAMAIHSEWNSQLLPDNLMEFTYYPPERLILHFLMDSK